MSRGPNLSILKIQDPTDSSDARWSVEDVNIRSRATLQVVRYLQGQLPRLPPTTVEIYKEIVDQFRRTENPEIPYFA